MDELFTIREAVIATIASNPSFDETNSIQVHREVVRLAAVKGWDLDELDDDFRVTDRADHLLTSILPSHKN